MNNSASAGFVRHALCALLFFAFSHAIGNATTYHVRTDGRNSNVGTSNTSGGAWLTIDYAADHVRAGDTIRVQAGIYNEIVSPGVNGTSTSAMVTYVADGAVTFTGLDLSNNNYLRFIGFTIDSNRTRQGCVLVSGTNNFIEFWNNTFTDAQVQGIRMYPGNALNSSLIIGNTAHTLGIGNYSGTGFVIYGDHNIIAYNTTTNIDPDSYLNEGSYNRILNNYSYGMLEQGGGHPDFLQNGNAGATWTYNLLESNFVVGAGTANDHIANLENPSGTMTENIFRRNVWHDLGSGTLGIHNVGAGFTYLRYYNNTTVDSDRAYPDNAAALNAWGTGLNNTYIYNNIEHESWGNSVTSRIQAYNVVGSISIDHNLGYDPNGAVSFTTPWTSQSHAQSNVNPGFKSHANDDFTITNAGGAYQKAGPLTTVSGSGTGTTFRVVSQTGGFFRGDDDNLPQYGGNLVKGDLITVGNDTVIISRVAGDSITVTEAFTWADGDPVFYGSNATPDIGAYPFMAGNFDLTTTYTYSGESILISPLNPALVRFVICYEDGIPTTVDDSSPYTCSVGTGSLEVRVYPLYASKTLYAIATNAIPDLLAPVNLRVVH